MQTKIEQLKQFLKLSPSDSFLKHALALEHLKIDDKEQAKILFEEVLKQDATYVGTYYHLAKLNEQMGLREEAINTYEAGLLQAKQTNQQHAYNELKGAYEELLDE